MLIFHSILLEKKVIFAGFNNINANDIYMIIMASVSMISPPLYGSLKRVFPYWTLSNLDFLQSQGYIAGVSNPMFK